MKIIINDKKVKIVDKEKLRTGNVNTYLINVEYNDIYKDRLLSVYFKNDDIKIIESVGISNVVKIPHEVLEKPGLLFIGIFSPNCKDNALIDRYCSNLDTLEIIEGAYDKEATYTEEITPNILEQYLQEMKDFYNESIKEYNDNALLETNKFNTIADARKQEIDAVSKEVSKNKTDIEEIERRVKTSEQNAKASETNAKTSEQNAQNSLNRVTEIETNITSIQEDINVSKAHIDEQKESMDKSVEDVEKLVDEATQQANISKANAELSIANAGQVSADKTSVENMKNEISSMKTSIEKTKSDTEQIKNDTQGIYNNTSALKEETLQAKTEVENSLENERNESDNKYSRALKDKVIDKDFCTIYADNSKIDGLVIKGDQLKQETHIPTANILYSEEKYWEVGSLEGTTGQLMENSTRLRTKELMAIDELTKYYCSLENSNYVFVNIHYYNLNKVWITAQQSISDNINNHQNQNFTTPENAKYFKLVIKKIDETEINLSDLKIAKPMMVKGATKIDYVEGYPNMPSLDYPSQINLTAEQNIQDNQENLLYIDNPDYKPGYTVTRYGVTFTVQDDLGLKCVGTSTQAVSIPLLGTYEDRFRTRLNIPRAKRIYSYIKNNENNKARIVVFSNNKYTVANNLQDSILTENLSAGYIYAEIVVNSSVDCVIYPQLTYERIDKFVPYNGYRKNISLPENEFNNAIGDYKGEIKKIDAKWCLVKYIKELVLDGTENWNANSTNKGYRYVLNLENAQIANTNNQAALCTHFKLGANAGTWNNLNVFNIYDVSGKALAFGSFTDISSVNDWKNILQEQYAQGIPITVFYTLEIPEIIELPEETQQALNSIELMEDLNNISIDNGTFSFEYNKPLYKAFEEVQQENINLKNNLQAQIDEIKALLSSTNTASLLAENLAKDNESEVI